MVHDRGKVTIPLAALGMRSRVLCSKQGGLPGTLAAERGTTLSAEDQKCCQARKFALEFQRVLPLLCPGSDQIDTAVCEHVTTYLLAEELDASMPSMILRDRTQQARPRDCGVG